MISITTSSLQEINLLEGNYRVTFGYRNISFSIDQRDLKMFTGAMVASITPFQDGKSDFQTLDELIDFQLENGIYAIRGVEKATVSAYNLTKYRTKRKKMLNLQI